MKNIISQLIKKTILKKSRSIVFTSYLGLLASMNMLLAFLYQWYVAKQKGPGVETDALFAGMIFPQVVLAIFSTSFSNVIIPLLANKKEEDFHKDAWNYFSLCGFFFIGLSLILFSFANHWVKWIVPGFNAAGIRLTVLLTRIQLIGLVFTALTGILWAVNQARHRFIYVETSAICANILGFCFLIWGIKHFGILAAAWALNIRMLFQVIFLFPSMGRYHKFRWRSPANKILWKKLHPLLLGASYSKTDLVVDRFFASLAPRGMLTLYHLSQQFYGAITTIIGKAFTNPIVPILSKHAHKTQWPEFNSLYLRRLAKVILVTLIGITFVVLLGQPVLAFFFRNRQFTSNNIRELWLLLIALAMGFIGNSVCQSGRKFLCHGQHSYTDANRRVQFHSWFAVENSGVLFGWDHWISDWNKYLFCLECDIVIHLSAEASGIIEEYCPNMKRLS